MRSAIQKITSLDHLVSKYDVFVFDLWGVVHDGTSLIQDTVRFIQTLDLSKKQIVFLSNSSRSSSSVKKLLESMGLVFKDKFDLITSGEFFEHSIKNDTSLSVRNKFYDIGGSFRSLESTKIEFVNNLEECDYVIITMNSHSSGSNTEFWNRKLEEAASRDIPALCINPDFQAPHGDSFHFTPGYFANKYRHLGGNVRYFGKPHVPIYEFALSKHMKGKYSPKKKAIAIGDSLSTDIKGANAFGIDSILFLRRGIHKSYYRKSEGELLSLCNEHDIYPTYITDDMLLKSRQITSTILTK